MDNTADEGPYFSQRNNPDKPMYLKYQSPCEKVDQRENSRQAANRELYEETGLSVKQKRFKYLAHNDEWDCDLYTLKLQTHEIPDHTEPNNMTVWMHYP